MKYDPEKHHRRSIRLNGYDYKQTGAYFITICARERASFFGAISGGEMHCTNAGCIADTAWQELPSRFPSLRLDTFIVMPNHVHGIVVIADVPVGADLRVGPDSEGAHAGAPLRASAFAPRHAPLHPENRGTP
jgi:hypothetical protein